MAYYIVADGWAGASNPHLHLNPHSPEHTQTYTKNIQNAGFFNFDSIITNSGINERIKLFIELHVRN